MIVVLVGTNPYSFERLVRGVDIYAEQSGETVFVQLGNTPYEPIHCEFARFVPRDFIFGKLREADLLICHGGFGSIRDGLAAPIPILAVPRKRELGECQDYQEELVQELSSQGLIATLDDITQLPQSIAQMKKAQPKAPPPCRIPQLISSFLSKLQT